MAFGDVGGPVTELIVTFKTVPDGPVDIKRGDALVLLCDYVVQRTTEYGQPVIGQAMADCDRNSAAIPVRVKGVCEFRYSGAAPVVRGIVGIVSGRIAGQVSIKPGGYEGRERGIVLRVNAAKQTCEVLL